MERSHFEEIDVSRYIVLNKQKQRKRVFSRNLSYSYNQSIFETNDFESQIQKAREYSNQHQLKDIETLKSRKMDFQNWSVDKNAKFEAFVVFADVRGFTKRFDPDNSNLDELSQITKKILSEMYFGCNEQNGVHVQFQGDREFAFFNNGNYNDAVVFALKLSQKISELTDLSIGVGINYGRVYATRIGKESKFSNIGKQPILIGKTVNIANKYEDEEAQSNEIVISKEIFDSLDRRFKDLFKSRKSYYVTNKNIDEIRNKITDRILENNHKSDYYKPWCND